MLIVLFNYTTTVYSTVYIALMYISYMMAESNLTALTGLLSLRRGRVKGCASFTCASHTCALTCAYIYLISGRARRLEELVRTFPVRITFMRTASRISVWAFHTCAVLQIPLCAGSPPPPPCTQAHALCQTCGREHALTHLSHCSFPPPPLTS